MLASKCPKVDCRWNTNININKQVHFKTLKNINKLKVKNSYLVVHRESTSGQCDVGSKAAKVDENTKFSKTMQLRTLVYTSYYSVMTVFHGGGELAQLVRAWGM